VGIFHSSHKHEVFAIVGMVFNSTKLSQSQARSRLTKLIFTLAVVFVCFGAGFFFTANGPLMIDDNFQYESSQWLVTHYGIGTAAHDLVDTRRYYAPLFEIVLGVVTEGIFPSSDQFWIRHGITFGGYLLGLYLLFVFLRHSGYSVSGSCLSVACVASLMRLGGHALFNVKDAPAAMGYLLCGAGLWLLFKKGCEKGFSMWLLALIGIVAVTPFLLRSPLLLYLPVICALLLWIAIVRKKPHDEGGFLRMTIVPILAGIAFIVSVSPYLWSFSLRDWMMPFVLFSEYPGQSYIHAFGFTWAPNAWPLWLPVSWIPLEAHPVAVLVTGMGLFRLLWLGGNGVHDACDLPLPSGNVWRVSFLTWMWGVVVLAWSVVLLYHPAFSNEGRQVLFLFPPLYLACALGLETLKPYTKWILTVLVTVFTMLTYWQWGDYAYIYKSPFLSPSVAQSFEGDYWAICEGKAVRAMKGLIGSQNVRLLGGDGITKDMLNRLRSLPHPDPVFSRIDWQFHRLTVEPPYFRLVPKPDAAVLQRIREGKEGLVWRSQLPTGLVVCTISLVDR